MNILNNWNNTPAYDGQGGERMTPGGHICKIVGAKIAASRSGREQLVLALEVIDEGELNGFYARAFKRCNESFRPGVGNAPGWPCRFFQNTQDANGNASPYFKGLIKTIEESNAAYKWNWQESGLKNLRVGFIFREEEYENQMGEIKTTVKPAWPASVQRIKDGVDVPEKKCLDGNKQKAFAAQSQAPAQNGGFKEVEDDDLPF